jgi:hypothetical protein
MKSDVLTPPSPWQAVQFSAMKAILGVAGSNLIERAAGPSDQCRRAQRWLRRARRSDIGSNAEAAADCGPGAEWFNILLIAAQDDEAENERDAEDHRQRCPTGPPPGMGETERSLGHRGLCTLAGQRVTS